MDPFIGEIRVFPYNYCPQDFLECNGQAVSIAEFQALFSVIGYQYGPDTSNGQFYLPKLNQTVALGQGQGPGLTAYALGATVGLPSVSLTMNQMPNHDHSVTVKRSLIFASENVSTPTGSSLAQTLYTGAQIAVPSFNQPPQTTMSPAALGSAGSGMAHENCQPYLALRFCISTGGTYPIKPS